MYIYSVTLKLETSIEQQWLDFMQTKHIADVLATGCFHSCSLRKLIDDDATHVIYNMQYATDTEEAYHAYQNNFGERLKGDVMNLFEGKFTAQRAFYKVISEHAV